MTDINLILSDAITGEELTKYSIHMGKALDLSQMLYIIRDNIKFNFEINHYVHVAQKGQAQQETVAEFLTRIAVPGGWLYRHSGDKNMIYVPDNRNCGSYLGATIHKIPIVEELSTPVGQE